MSTEIDFSFRLSSPVIPAGGEARLVYGLFQIHGGGDQKSMPSNLGFLVDTSDSMRIHLVTETQFAELVKNGHAQEVITDGIPAYQIASIPMEMVARLPRRIDFVADALRVASRILRDEDFFSLVAFAGQAQCLIEQAPGEERERLNQTASMLETLRLGDETRLDAGLELAYQETRRMPGREFASRLILLTDGHTRNVRECYEWARQARQDGIKLTTMGIGSEFNEELLIPLADLTGGNAYYIETPQELGKAFKQELGSALRVSCSNLELKLQLAGGCVMRRVYRVLPELGDFDQGPDLGGSFSLLLGDYDPATRLALLVELVVPGAPPGSQRLAQMMLAWNEASDGGARQNLRKDVTIERGSPGEERPDPEVMNIVDRVGAYKLGLQALEDARGISQASDPGQKDAATLRLRQAATRLLDMGEPLLARAMREQADVLEKNGTLDPDQAKKLRYETRRISQRY